MKYPRENAGGGIYTVDEVSGLLGIPLPTLYRYLREYSILHLRREGRISIPEDSFDRIREAGISTRRGSARRRFQGQAAATRANRSRSIPPTSASCAGAAVAASWRSSWLWR